MDQPVFTEGDLQLLHPLLRLIVDSGAEEGTPAAGMAAALRLVEARGGVKVYIPHQAKPDDELLTLLGPLALAAVQAVYGGEALTVPQARDALMRIRNRWMKAMRATMSVRDVARHFRLDRRRVQQITNSDAEERELAACGQLETDQLSLFS